MRELPAVLAGMLLLGAFRLSGLLRRGRPVRGDVAWSLLLSAAAVAGHFAFRPSPAFLTVLAAPLLMNAVRLRLGLPLPGLEPFRYAIPAAVFAFTGTAWPTILASLAVAANRRNFRFLLLAAGRVGGPFSISPLDVDRIVPPPIRYEPSGREKGMTLLEVTVGLAVLAAVSTALFTASAGRAARLRALSETARAREAAVSELERLGAVPIAELRLADGTTFAVPGGGEPGTREVSKVEPGVFRIAITVPRRGAAPIRIETRRTEVAP